MYRSEYMGLYLYIEFGGRYHISMPMISIILIGFDEYLIL